MHFRVGEGRHQEITINITVCNTHNRVFTIKELTFLRERERDNHKLINKSGNFRYQ